MTTEKVITFFCFFFFTQEKERYGKTRQDRARQDKTTEEERDEERQDKRQDTDKSRQ